MPAQFDLNFFPFHRVKGQERPIFPGVFASTPPRRTARGREEDILIVYLTISGNAPFAARDYQQINAQLAERFYQTPGSLTSALRNITETLNQFLLERNLRTTGRGQYVIGRLILCVLRGSQFIIVECGPTHVFHIRSDGVRQVHDAQISGRGLGTSQTTTVYFSQLELHPGDLIMLAPHLSPGWQEALLAENHAIPADALRRKLLIINSDDLNAVLIQAQSGNGKISILRTPQPDEQAVAKPAMPSPPAGAEDVPAVAPGEASRQSATAPTAAVQPARESEEKKQFEPPASAADQIPPTRAPGVQPSPPGRDTPTSRFVRSRPSTAEKRKAGQRVESRFVTPQPASDIPEVSPPAAAPRRGLFLWLAKGLHSARQFTQAVSRGLQKVVPRLLPGLQENEPNSSTSWMAFIAVAVPLLVVIVASVVYMRYGRIAQYDENYNLAVQAAVGAIGQEDPAVVRHAWESALFYLDKAESYQVTQESQALRQEAQGALDAMDGIIRLDFRPAIYGGLSRSIQVSRMAATNTDLYLLNSANGNVLRAFLTNQGYEMDGSFICEPGVYEGYVVGPLIDIAALPGVNEHNATLIGMDASGTLLYCAPDRSPEAFPLAAPDITWKGIAGFTLDTNNQDLYVLDPPGNAVWFYSGIRGSFPDLPILFFGEQVPENMPAAIDLAVNGDDLYLLFEDGHVTICTLSRLSVVPTRCSDPATLVDNRLGHQPGTTITDALFSEMLFTTPPDPSLYMLVPLAQAVYRFNPRPDSLNLQGQYRATVEQSKTLFAEPATAITISPTRYIFLSIGNQIYFATDVP